MKNYILILTMGMMLLANACENGILEDDKLSLEKHAYTGNQLRVDGYYYQEKDDYLYTVYFFFRNGIIRYIGGGYTKDELEQALMKGDLFDDKISWGVFQVDGNNIQFERWYPSSGGPFPAYVRSGEILNDTTFIITESYRMKGGVKTEVREKNEVYQFQEFSPKPDSTNRFVP